MALRGLTDSAAGALKTTTQAGYCERLGTFLSTGPSDITTKLKTFVVDADKDQVRAWTESIRVLRSAIERLAAKHAGVSEDGWVLLEYTIPLESRRVDALILLNGAVVVLEFKGKTRPTQADVDQAAAYARDLRAYHRECATVPVHCALVLTRSAGEIDDRGAVDIIGPDQVSACCEKVIRPGEPTPDAGRFLEIECYQPLPSLIKAARELFQSGTLKRVHRAAAATEPTLAKCAEIVHQTASQKRRALILICGVPGAGKTLVGLQLAHAKYLDDLAIADAAGGKPTAPAVFLSGNGPLVEVLQYELKSAGGDGKAFVRGVHEYVKTFTRAKDRIPPNTSLSMMKRSVLSMLPR
ncbi:MAG: DUF2075 domain-containing protein [Candidatus Handelsmanbacteria bacterium]|nr:DUF2075 domain-containing protein [Candidatus Handelsmanbacteria bacterium]